MDEGSPMVECRPIGAMANDVASPSGADYASRSRRSPASACGAPTGRVTTNRDDKTRSCFRLMCLTRSYEPRTDES
jgi:hypothetical protein